MYDYRKLRGLITEHCGTLEKYAKAIGISLTTLHTRLANKTQFTQDEIRLSRKLLDLDTPEKSDAVFFTIK